MNTKSWSSDKDSRSWGERHEGRPWGHTAPLSLTPTHTEGPVAFPGSAGLWWGEGCLGNTQSHVPRPVWSQRNSAVSQPSVNTHSSFPRRGMGVLVAETCTTFGHRIWWAGEGLLQVENPPRVLVSAAPTIPGVGVITGVPQHRWREQWDTHCGGSGRRKVADPLVSAHCIQRQFKNTDAFQRAAQDLASKAVPSEPFRTAVQAFEDSIYLIMSQ